MTNQKLRDENNALLRKIWATGHCDSALQTEIALLLDARVREIEKLQSAVEPPSTSDAEFLSLVGHCSNCSCQDCREFFKADARARVEPTADRYVGEQEHIPAPISGGTSTITGYDPSTRRAVLAEPAVDGKSALDEIVRISEEAGLYNGPTPRRADQWSPEEIARARMEQSINMCQGCFRPMNVCVCSQMNRT